VEESQQNRTPYRPSIGLQEPPPIRFIGLINCLESRSTRWRSPLMRIERIDSGIFVVPILPLVNLLPPVYSVFQFGHWRMSARILIFNIACYPALKNNVQSNIFGSSVAEGTGINIRTLGSDKAIRFQRMPNIPLM
jgi:hypothetical protein